MKSNFKFNVYIVSWTLPNKILRRKVNWIGHILGRNYHLRDAIEGEITEVKGVGIRRTLIRYYLKN